MLGFVGCTTHYGRVGLRLNSSGLGSCIVKNAAMNTQTWIIK